MMLNDIIEEVVLATGEIVRLNGEQTAEETCLNGARYLTAFGLRYGLPVWVYELDGITIEKRVLMPHQQNTTYINYRDRYYEIVDDKNYPPLRISVLADGGGLTLDTCTIHQRLYAIEQARGYIYEGELWSPG